ncbi:uncharacterized protein LOC133183595 [Saccostrea echinata]|uniref:uncharacterized protein LOC133183595 n=1 Tax=Saccostrea echinata TaxID=191078 RepID=UPI002A81BF3E|nr:uncharacterized protein LOC133183595 [Saccostrea echinata]
MNLISQIRTEFERHLISIDTYEVVKQAKSLVLVEIILQHAENQNNKVKLLIEKCSLVKLTEAERTHQLLRLEKDTELLKKSTCCCGLALQCLNVKYANEAKLYSIWRKLCSDLRENGYCKDWLFTQEVLKNSSDVTKNAKRMRRRVQRGVSYNERGATHYQFVAISGSSFVDHGFRILQDEVDVAKFAKEK